jgi:hypothetical protein
MSNRKVFLDQYEEVAIYLSEDLDWAQSLINIDLNRVSVYRYAACNQLTILLMPVFFKYESYLYSYS